MCRSLAVASVTAGGESTLGYKRDPSYEGRPRSQNVPSHEGQSRGQNAPSHGGRPAIEVVAVGAANAGAAEGKLDTKDGEGELGSITTLEGPQHMLFRP